MCLRAGWGRIEGYVWAARFGGEGVAEVHGRVLVTSNDMA